jgi:hypothetical protein
MRVSSIAPPFPRPTALRTKAYRCDWTTPRAAAPVSVRAFQVLGMAKGVQQKDQHQYGAYPCCGCVFLREIVGSLPVLSHKSQGTPWLPSPSPQRVWRALRPHDAANALQLAVRFSNGRVWGEALLFALCYAWRTDRVPCCRLAQLATEVICRSLWGTRVLLSRLIGLYSAQAFRMRMLPPPGCASSAILALVLSAQLPRSHGKLTYVTRMFHSSQCVGLGAQGMRRWAQHSLALQLPR